ncbi:nucleotidyltransferase [Oceanobacillus oncorhynchi]|uniref:nucleotidyltransferase n=1 Tax=Oceanobacillus oncorhynchi TaxID=545501 RepID=UPI002116F513|nr:nucleotidyltransferase [Oceanobacillus oncorhynchi]UUI38706.1 nucleotidyltransferase [Oceanobacillus oncorhynchi]
MEACGLIVEYNPFHYGHQYHLKQAREKTDADCIVAVMSGNFLQRGEPAIMDKYNRAKAAILGGADLVVELPYVYAVQHSDYFAKGAIDMLYHSGVSAVCFGSEAGIIDSFSDAYQLQKEHQNQYESFVKKYLNKGHAYPDAATKAYQHIFGISDILDVSRPNNILGLSYVRAIKDAHYPIKPITIKRIENNYHDTAITGNIASATSIRKEVLNNPTASKAAAEAMPETTSDILQSYKHASGYWHDWELYFSFLKYRVQTMTLAELQQIEGIVEGLEHRIVRTAMEASSFQGWMTALKTKRYTWTRLQRIFVHILTNTRKEDNILGTQTGYIRVLAMNKTGQAYLNQQKKKADLPFITKINQIKHPFLEIEERAAKAYYSILPGKKQRDFFLQEIKSPIIIK